MRHGFTIVELLIVIVVIAILASVTAFAFNGVQDKAKNAAIINTVSQLEKGLRLYYAQTGMPFQITYATGSAFTDMNYNAGSVNMVGVCVGNWESLAPTMPNCINWIGNGSYSYQRVQEAFQTELTASGLTASFPKIPIPNVPVASVSDTSKTYQVYGLRYAYNNYAASPKSYIYYAKNGKNSCAPQDASVDIVNTQWLAPSSQSYTGTHVTGGDYTTNNSTYCLRTIKY